MRRFTGSPSIFYVAIKSGRYEVARFLLERGCPIIPFWDLSGIEDPGFMVLNSASDPEFQRFLHERIADFLALHVNSEVYFRYYEKVPFRPDSIREKSIQKEALQQRLEEQRRFREASL